MVGYTKSLKSDRPINPIYYWLRNSLLLQREKGREGEREGEKEGGKRL